MTQEQFAERLAGLIREAQEDLGDDVIQEELDLALDALSPDED